MKISYAILTHNEGEYINKLLSLICTHKRDVDEIVIVDDFSTDSYTIDILNNFSKSINLHYRNFDGDHTQKNYLNSKCSGDYILQLDADELVSIDFINMLPDILEKNTNVDLFIMPRINTVDGLTDEWIQKWKWSINEKGWVNFPDWQMRLYKNSKDIVWDGLLHSKIIGYNEYTFLPEDETFCIIHQKHLDRQIEQNNLYDRIELTGRTKYKV